MKDFAIAFETEYILSFFYTSFPGVQMLHIEVLQRVWHITVFILHGCFTNQSNQDEITRLTIPSQSIHGNKSTSESPMEKQL